MPRPRSENPRSERIVARVTVGELEAAEAQARSVGATMSDWARGRLFGDAAARERLEHPLVAVPAGVVGNPGIVGAVAPQPHSAIWSAGDWGCPEAGCPTRGQSKESRCPRHGTLLTRKLK